MAKGHIIAGLDIGTNTIKLLVIQKRNKEWEVLSYQEMPSFGLRKGAVVDAGEVSKNIQTLLSETEKNSSKKITSVFVNIGGNHIYITPSDGIISVSRANQIISQEDIDRVLQATRAINIPQNEEVLDVFPKEFIIDDQKGIKQPLGLRGIRLEAKVLLLCVFSPYFINLTQAVLNSKLHIDDIVPSPLAASEAVLTREQKELGVALIDIGASTTSLAVFEEGNLLHLAVFPIGSANITNDIAIGLKTEIFVAESIKKQYGSCMLVKQDKEKKDEKINIEKKKIEIIENSSVVSFTRKDLVDIIEPRVSEILDLILKELKKIGRQELLPCGIVLTGGGAKISKIKELTKEQLKLPVQIGKIKNILGLDEDTALATVAGLVLSSAVMDETDKEGLSGVLKGFWSKIKKMLKVLVP
ncbi:MAG: cell division protein FtsA [Candidatus Staskawiczbacteria bacterium RIFOXYB2_FULL_32_9]|uniref:Cell division protein FtsA n=1 Tax=Candidatus Staskawiczbacteria bacterium RIFOXYD1_FULL_32_13 TaxID=1802234 RepID=A0A1G2JM06_9BACT|nr:MAG: Cell division protein ftsA [Parcubacteria group bacterium GW2011_GWC2_32_10]OGZ78405.1 MAG: cell division protein FtsA [Candidatus Staskawiczbacteria bacterium RIFOXYA2_FULL_32_7]OGZ78657.1 MAG: cell division protein FtsA [Candidatus Staskawiczbacteria bacterium RIFOXYB1_FULL_32_11]OGZ81550.1 MAG: cell division protein FtsA [Candidatus Staskawiczbacteria bacterium RIFOXYB2_FULL_32_9]OGZ86896.1 MAG: cell division protein FtsA [Candidatus Staskawiczbacteria bacterium RIFOXYC2_FULL_32_10]